MSSAEKKRKLFLGGILLLVLVDLLIQVWLVNRGMSNNQGFGWGLPFSLGWRGELRWPLIWVNVLSLAGIGWWYRSSTKEIEKLGLLMVILGGIINLIMRLIWGEVVDYLCITGLCFNMADILIVVGVLLVIKDSRGKK